MTNDPFPGWTFCSQCRHWQRQEVNPRFGLCVQLRERAEPLGLTIEDYELPETMHNGNACDRFSPAPATQEATP